MKIMKKFFPLIIRAFFRPGQCIYFVNIIRFICRFIRYAERCTEETRHIFRETYPHVCLPANRQSLSSLSFITLKVLQRAL